MEPSKAAMKAALRVLTALSERHEPEPADVDELHWYAPAERERPIDELVCDAIQRALKDREQKRKALKMRLREDGLLVRPAEPESAPANIAGEEERRREIQKLRREYAKRREEYLALSDKLKRLGMALQQATASLLAADDGKDTSHSEAARETLASVAGEVDLSGITQLLNEHVRLRQRLTADRQTLKEHGIE
jgi:hypothetical protein